MIPFVWNLLDISGLHLSCDPSLYKSSSHLSLSLYISFLMLVLHLCYLRMVHLLLALGLTSAADTDQNTYISKSHVKLA